MLKTMGRNRARAPLSLTQKALHSGRSRNISSRSQSTSQSYSVRVEARVEVLNELAIRHIDNGNLIRARKREIPAAPVGREHDALRSFADANVRDDFSALRVDHGERVACDVRDPHFFSVRSEEHTSELQSPYELV